MPQCSPQGLLVRHTSLSVQLGKWGNCLEVLHTLKTGWKEPIRSQHCCLFNTPPTWNGDSSVGSELLLFFSPCRHLFSYITKEKQTESLVEKLCQRFRTARWVVIFIFPAKRFCFSGIFRRNELVCGGSNRLPLYSSRGKVTNADITWIKSLFFF